MKKISFFPQCSQKVPEERQMSSLSAKGLSFTEESHVYLFLNDKV